MTELIENVKQAWAHFDESSLVKFESVYSPEVKFIDPAGEINGRDALVSHLRSQCLNLIDCRFEFDTDLEILGRHQSMLAWTMIMRHKSIAGGRPTTTHGVSVLKHNTMVTLHRDFFDLGEMVYQHLPVVGGLVNLVRGKLRYAQGKHS